MSQGGGVEAPGAQARPEVGTCQTSVAPTQVSAPITHLLCERLFFLPSFVRSLHSTAGTGRFETKGTEKAT